MKILDFSSGKKEKLDFGTVYDGCGSRIVVSLHKGQTLYLGSNKTKAITKEKVKVEGEEYQRVLSNGETVTRRRPSYTKTVETEKEKSFDYSYKLKIKFSKKIPD